MYAVRKLGEVEEVFLAMVIYAKFVWIEHLRDSCPLRNGRSVSSFFSLAGIYEKPQPVSEQSAFFTEALFSELQSSLDRLSQSRDHGHSFSRKIGESRFISHMSNVLLLSREYETKIPNNKQDTRSSFVILSPLPHSIMPIRRKVPQ